MFKKLLSRFGIGAPQIERIEHDHQIRRGETLTGQIYLLGGRSAVRIEEINLSLQTEAHFFQGETQHHVQTLREQTLNPHLRLEAGAHEILPFELLVPIETPVSHTLSQVWLRTELELPWAVDPHDRDPVRVMPEAATDHLLRAVRALGFKETLVSGSCLAQAESADGLSGLTQVFEFMPGTQLSYNLREISDLALLVRANPYDAEIQLEVNRQGQPPADWLPDGIRKAERRLRFRLRHNERFPTSGLQELLLKAAGQSQGLYPLRAHNHVSPLNTNT